MILTPTESVYSNNKPIYNLRSSENKTWMLEVSHLVIEFMFNE